MKILIRAIVNSVSPLGEPVTNTNVQRTIAFLIAAIIFSSTLISITNNPFVNLASASTFEDQVLTPADVELLRIINENRSVWGHEPLQFNASLQWISVQHALDMIDNDFFSHDSSTSGPFNGSNFQQRVQGYTDYVNASIGENIACNTWGIDPYKVMEGWVNSPPHWDNINNSDFKEIGIGMVTGDYMPGNSCDSSTGAVFVTDFGGFSRTREIEISSDNISFTPSNPDEGVPVLITVTVDSMGTGDVYPVTLQFFDGDPSSGGTQIGTDQTLPYILVHGESGVISVDWDTTGEAGAHEIYIVYKGIVLAMNNMNINPSEEGESILTEAGFRITPGTTGNVATLFIFNGSSLPNSSSITNFTWDFDDGSDPSFDEITIHAFPAKGTYTIKLDVTYDNGTQITRTLEISIENIAPTITTSVTDPSLSLDSGEWMVFDLLASDDDGDEITYSWSLDGQVIGTGPEYNFSSSLEGTYELVATASDGTDSTSQSWTITVESPGDTKENKYTVPDLLLIVCGIGFLLCIAFIVILKRRR